MPPIFICNPPRLFAEARSSGGTISAITDAEAGDPNAKPTPKRNALARITYGLSKCVTPRTARQIATAACHRFTAHSIFFRSIRSAMAPAGSVNREKGSDESVAMSERSRVQSDLPRVLSTQKAAVPWAAIALPEIKFATQNLLKEGFRSAVQVDVSDIGSYPRTHMVATLV